MFVRGSQSVCEPLFLSRFLSLPLDLTCSVFYRSQGELQLPVCVEDELGRELPNSALFYRPVRERVYAVLFNLYHHSFLHNRDKDKPTEEQHQVPTVQVRTRGD